MAGCRASMPRLIDEALFNAAIAARFRNIRRSTSSPTATPLPWALSGVATCDCGSAMRLTGRADHRRRVECAGRRQGSDCQAPSFFADVVEDQLGQLLTAFAIPADRRAALVQRWQERRGERQSTAAERQRLERKAERVKLLYIEGELDDADYRRQRAEIAESLAAIPVDDGPSTEAVGQRLAQMLADLAQAWTLATPVERNAIAREMFSDVLIENRTAVAVKPRPELAPFFESLACQPDSEITSERKRRGSVARDRRRRTSLGAVPLSHSPASIAPATGRRTVRLGHESVSYSRGSLAGDRVPCATRRSPFHCPRLRRIARNDQVGAPTRH